MVTNIKNRINFNYLEFRERKSESIQSSEQQSLELESLWPHLDGYSCPADCRSLDINLFKKQKEFIFRLKDGGKIFEEIRLISRYCLLRKYNLTPQQAKLLVLGVSLLPHLHKTNLILEDIDTLSQIRLCQRDDDVNPDELFNHDLFRCDSAFARRPKIDRAQPNCLMQ